MLLVELIIIAAVLVVLFVQVEKWTKSSKKRTNNTATLGVSNNEIQDSPQERVLKLGIEGTQPFAVQEAGFFSQFGISVQNLTDARKFVGPGTLNTFPQAVAGAIKTLYQEGNAFGPEIMRIICHDRELAEGEALYFALTRGGGTNNYEYYMYAFLDKSRN